MEKNLYEICTIVVELWTGENPFYMPISKKPIPKVQLNPILVRPELHMALLLQFSSLFSSGLTEAAHRNHSIKCKQCY